MSASDLCTNFITKKENSKVSKDKNILEFATAEWGLGLGTVDGVPPLYPAQRFILKCYYGIELDNGSNRDIIINDHFNEIERYRFNEVEYVKYLYNEGRINVPEVVRSYPNLILCLGRRAGKSLLTSCIIAYETYKLLSKYQPQEYFGIMPEDDIRLTCVSTSKETASELFNRVTGHLDRSEFFRRFRLPGTKQSMYLQTQRDIDKYGRNHRATVSIHVAPCSAKGLRGHNNIAVALDEMAHFFEDEKSKGLITGGDKNDRSIYNAVTPSIARFKSKEDNVFHGKIICISSPSIKSGKFYEEYERAFRSDNNDLLMVQAPTWEIDPNLSTDYLKNKFSENPIVFASEHGAIFDDRLKGWIEDPEVVRQCIVPGLRLKDRTSDRTPHFAGIDIGLKKDGSAICITHHVQELLNGAPETLIEVDFYQVRYAELENKSHFTPDELADWIASFTNKFYIVRGMMDQYYGMAIIPLLASKGLKQYEFRTSTDNTNSLLYQNLNMNFLSKALRLPEGLKTGDIIQQDSELVAEILSLQAMHKAKYIIDVSAPERDGAHDDLSEAFARSVLLATEYKAKGYVGMRAAPLGSEQAHRFKVSRAKEAMRISLNRPTRGGMTGRSMFSNSVYGSSSRRGF